MDKKKNNIHKRSFFDAARIDRLTSDWFINNNPIDELLKHGGICNIRGHSRDLALNDAYYNKYLKIAVANIVGDKGAKFQSRVTNDEGSPDVVANARIEEGWKEWTKKENCSANQKLDFIQIKQQCVEHVARDGEVLCRLIRDPDVNRFGFALQLLEADHLDDRTNTVLRNGHSVINGIEFDKWGRAVAYFLFREHPNNFGRVGTNQLDRVDANDLLHVFEQIRQSQSRGLPWGHAAMFRLHQLKGYDEAELTAARVEARKIGITIPPEGETYGGENDVRDLRGNSIDTTEPGGIYELLPGSTFETFNPARPTSNYSPFIKGQLRGVASALGVSYNSLANDLEGVNFSSIRHGMNDERDMWRIKQKWLIEDFCKKVFSAWLEMSLLTGAVNLPLSRFEKFNNPHFMPRGWKFVEPLKDAQANVINVENGFKSRTKIMAEQGEDFDDLLAELQAEEQKIADSNLSFINSNTNNNDTDIDEEESEQQNQD